MSRSVSEVSVLIVGAGPTGLTLACDLARRNVDFRLVDKSPAYFVGSRGKGLQPRTLEVLDDLGVVDRILGQGRFHLPFRGYEGTAIIDHDLYEGHNPTPSVPYASPLIIPQWRVEETLRQLLHDSGKEVELQSELVWIDTIRNGNDHPAFLYHAVRSPERVFADRIEHKVDIFGDTLEFLFCVIDRHVGAELFQ